MTRHPITTTGNAKPWRSDGYRDRMSVPAPIVDDAPRDWFIIGVRLFMVALTVGVVGYAGGWL